MRRNYQHAGRRPLPVATTLREALAGIGIALCLCAIALAVYCVAGAPS